MRVLATLAVATVLLSSARPCRACACCNGFAEQQPVGWSKSDPVLLIHSDNITGCVRTTNLERWRVNEDEPEGCYDLLHAPEVRVPCSSIRTDDAFEPQPSSVVSMFSGAIESFTATRLRVEHVAHPIRGRLVVSMRAEGKQHVLFDEVLGAVTTNADDLPPEVVEVSLVPSPFGEWGALIVGNWAVPRDDGDMMYEGSLLRWVRVPAGVGAPSPGFHKVKAVAVKIIVRDESATHDVPNEPEPVTVVVTNVPPAEPTVRGCACQWHERPPPGAAVWPYLVAFAALAWRRLVGRVLAELV